MKDKLLSCVSIFDFLAMIVPGGLILALISHWLGYSWLVDPNGILNEFVAWGYISVLCYLIGLIHNTFMNLIGEGFRNNPYFIWKAARISKSSAVKCAEYKEHSFIYDCIHILHTIFTKAKTNIGTCLKKTEHKECNYNTTSILDQYYKAYYYGMKYPSHEPIAVMERQIVFIRNLLIPILVLEVYILLPCSNILKELRLEDNICIISFLIGLGILLLFITMVSRQNKIYQCVWENYEYLKRLEQREKELIKQ